jgi:glucose/arabinose dehydrogenase
LRRALLAAGAALAAATLAPASAQAGLENNYELDRIGRFFSPVHVADAPGYEKLLFVVEQPGRVRVLKNGVKKPKPFLDIRERVTFGGEQGLLSIAFHPDYETNRRFYVYYVDNGGDIVVDEFKRSKSSGVRAKAKTRRRVIKVQHDQASNHNGGQLQFNQVADDGLLYLATGDGGPQMDPENDAQDPDSLLGKLLRIDPIPDGGGPGHDNPADNPFVGMPGADEVWSLGFRNPFRFSFDLTNGDLTVGDVGGSDWEEIDWTTLGASQGANFGWNDFEGTHETSFGVGANASPHTPPIAEYANVSDTCAVTGGYVVRDGDLGALVGDYIYSDFCDGELTVIDVPTGAPVTTLELDPGNPSSFGEDRDTGQLYIADLNGPVYALEPSTP